MHVKDLRSGSTIDMPDEILDQLLVVELALRGLANERFREPDEDDFTALIGQVSHVMQTVEDLKKRMKEDRPRSAAAADNLPRCVPREVEP